MTGFAALWATLILQAGIADIGQISAPAAVSTGMVQAQPAAERRATQASQLSDRDRAPSTQAQVGSGARTASPPPALSNSAEGRTINAGPVGGSDRCDPAAREKSPKVDCAAIIETRATEFAKLAQPEPDSSRAPKEFGDEDTADGVARRLAQGQVSGSSTAEAVAGGKIQPSQPMPQTGLNIPGQSANPAFDISTQAVVDALVSHLTAAGAAGVTVITPPR